MLTSQQTVVFLALVAVFTSLKCNGDIVVRQIDPDIPTESWIVKGIASYEHSGANPKLFIFQCMSTVDNGDHLQWIKVGSQLQGTLSIITGGLELFIHTPVVGSAGIYICRDTLRNEEVQFELTDSSPAARAANSSLVYYVGDTAVIEMYASAVTPFVEGSLIWKKDNEALNEGILSSDNKTLTIPNVQLSNTGLYKLTAVVAAGIFTTSTTSNTTLQVLEPPFIIEHPHDNQEWESVQFICTAEGSLSLSISWHKVNGVLPSSSTITNDDSSNLTNTTSTLNITELRANDSGIYYCTASDGSRSSSSNNATLTVIFIPISPTNLQSNDISLTSAIIYWTIPYLTYTPEQYTVYYGTSQSSLTSYSEVVNGSVNLTAVDMEYSVTLTGLETDTLYYYRISSTNTEGVTNSINIGNFTTLKIKVVAPYALVGVEYYILSESRLKINFTKPSHEISRGVVYYIIIVRRYGVNDEDGQTATIHGDSTSLEAYIGGLEGGIPYIVSIFAVNSAGAGNITSTTLFTKEEIPPPPETVISERINGTHMKVTWDPLPLTRAKGFIINYSISYSRVTATTSNTRDRVGLYWSLLMRL